MYNVGLKSRKNVALIKSIINRKMRDYKIQNHIYMRNFKHFSLEIKEKKTFFGIKIDSLLKVEIYSQSNYITHFNFRFSKQIFYQ